MALELKTGGGIVRITCRNRQALLQEVRHRLALHQGFTLATLNVDHPEKLRRDEDFRRVYAAHDLVVADGNPIVWLSRIARHPVGLAPGSELAEPLARIAADTGAPAAQVAGSDAAPRKALWRI